MNKKMHVHMKVLHQGVFTLSVDCSSSSVTGI